MVYTEKHRKIDIVCLIIFPISFVVLFFLSITGHSNANYGTTYVATTELVAAGVSMLMPLTRLKTNYKLPYWFVAVMTADFYLYGFMLFLGTYDNTWWWSPFTHTLSSFLVTMVIFLAMCLIESYAKNITFFPLSAFLTTLFLTGLAFGNIWEIIEGVIDASFNQPFMQGHVGDTLEDLLMDSVGAGLMTIVACIRLHKMGPLDIVEKSMKDSVPLEVFEKGNN